MSQQKPQEPVVTLTQTSDYREGYSNSVQVRMSVWDFFLVFGNLHQNTPDKVELRSFQGIYLSPQQAKALHNVLAQNIAQYEQTFGAIALEPLPPSAGPVH